MQTPWINSIAVFVIVLASAAGALGQGRGGMMSALGTSGFGSGGFGSSGFGNSGFGNSGVGSGGFGGSGFGNSGFGNSAFGGSGFGNSGFGNSGFGNSGFGNSGFGNSGFGSGQYGGGQAFVGRDATDMQNVFQQTSRAQMQFFNNMNRQMSRNNRNRTPTAPQNPPQPMRVEVRTAFAAPQPTSEAVANTLRRRLAKILADHNMSQPVLTVQGGTAVLTGVATSDSERQVIAQLVAMEPGVRAVRNEMTVADAATP
jgi:PPE-repeat protein